MKKIFAVAMAVVLVLSMGLSAFAETYTVKVGETITIPHVMYEDVEIQQGDLFAPSLWYKVDNDNVLLDTTEDMITDGKRIYDNDGNLIGVQFTANVAVTGNKVGTSVLRIRSDVPLDEDYTEDVVYHTVNVVENDPENPDDSIVASGTCGDNLTWTLDSEGLLTISGTGEMYPADYNGIKYHLKEIKKVWVNTGVTSIGESAFEGCSSLTSINLPDGVTSIGRDAFHGCTSLTSITIPEGVTSIEWDAFYGCTSLTSISIPEGVTSIGGYAFYGCASLTGINLPDGVTSIGGDAFYGCASLTGIVIPDSVTSIGESAFEGCTSLTSIVIPNSVTSMGDSAFRDCTSLTSIVIPDGVTSIGDFAFSDCTSLTGIVIPDGVTSIGWRAFSGCTSLTNIVIPDGVTSIGDFAFSDCTSLTGIVIPDGVTSIGWRAFSGCTSLTSISIPDGVTSIGEDAFNGCTSLKDVYYGGSKTDWQKISIDRGNIFLTDATIHYNSSSHTHRFAESWKTDKTDHWQVCLDCKEIVGKAAHTLTWVMDKEPTEKAVGYQHEECSVCGYKQSEKTEIPMLPHTHKFSEEWRLDETSHWHPCSGCEEKADEAAHDFAWVVDEEPTEEDYGFQHEECTVCGYKQSENTEIPSVGWGDITEEDRAEAGFGSVEDIPQGIWLAGVPESVDYCGAAITLPDLRVYSGKQLLKLNTDYTVKYANNTKVSTEKTRAKVTVTGKGNFTGSQAVEFEILPYSIEGLSVAPLSANENGKVQKPSPVVTAEVGGKTVTLKKGTDYTVAYPGTDTKAPDYDPDAFKAAGTHGIQIIGKGNYAGETVCELTLLEKSYINISKATVGKIANAVYDGEPQEPVITLTYSKTPLEEGEDYEVAYYNNVEVGTASVVISGKGDFFGSVTKTFKITGVALSKAKIEGLVVKETYTGEQILGAENAKLYIAATKTTPQIDLVEGVDYTVAYTNNVKAGKATVAFVGKGGYTGTVKKTFTIAATNAFEVEPLEAQTYTKGSVKPLPVVKFDGKTLVNGTDYTLTYKNNTKVADLTVKSVPTVTVKGKGNFTGSIPVQFEIVPSSLDNVTATVTDIVYANKANLCKPTITVVDTNGSKLASGTDYEKVITYTYAADTTVTQLVKKEYVTVERKAWDEVDKLDIIPAGTVINATLTGKGNYADSTLTVPFRFVQGSLAKATVKITAQTYTGRPIRLKKSDITVKIGKDTLTAADYEIVSYKNNTAKGTAKVTLRGIGNYGGTKEVSFTISARKMN